MAPVVLHGRRIAPRHVRMVTASGRVLGNLYEGLTPDARIRERLRHPLKPRTCATGAGTLARIGRLLGIATEVHAQSNCIYTLCQSCSIQIMEASCSVVGCGSGQFTNGYNVGEDDMGFYEMGRGSCYPNKDGCPCAIEECENPDCNEGT